MYDHISGVILEKKIPGWPIEEIEQGQVYDTVYNKGDDLTELKGIEDIVVEPV